MIDDVLEGVAADVITSCLLPEGIVIASIGKAVVLVCGITAVTCGTVEVGESVGLS